MQEFLVELMTTAPKGTDPEEVDRRWAAEAVHVAELAISGHLFRMWRPEGEMRNIGIWLAETEEELHERVLGTLPLRPWMSVSVTPLVSHPNDPGRRGDAA